jgi:uncharacterized protein
MLMDIEKANVDHRYILKQYECNKMRVQNVHLLQGQIITHKDDIDHWAQFAHKALSL